jgi:hypothetical protein
MLLCCSVFGFRQSYSEPQLFKATFINGRVSVSLTQCVASLSATALKRKRERLAANRNRKKEKKLKRLLARRNMTDLEMPGQVINTRNKHDEAW